MRCTDDATFLHEPRALWTVQAIQTPVDDTAADGRVVVPREHFRNVSRYPITLTHLCVAAINYTFRSYAGANPATSPTDIHNSAVIQHLVKVYLTAPFSLPFTRKDMLIGAQAPLPTGEPGLMYDSASYASGPWGVSRWDFERSLYLPNKSNVQFDLSAYYLPSLFNAQATPVTYASIQFDEVHNGKFGGNSRLRERRPLFPFARNSVNRLFAPDAFGDATTQFESEVSFPPGAGFSGKEWRTQESNRGQDWSRFTGFAVQIDQIAHDEQIQTFGAPYAGQPLAPLSMRVGTRARVRGGGGTGEWWWRPGAPLCLVTPTMTPASVHRLPTPIVLGPGERLEMELEVPSFVYALGGELGSVRPTYQIGVSMLGWASVEGAGPGREE